MSAAQAMQMATNTRTARTTTPIKSALVSLLSFCSLALPDSAVIISPVGIELALTTAVMVDSDVVLVALVVSVGVGDEVDEAKLVTVLLGAELLMMVVVVIILGFVTVVVVVMVFLSLVALVVVVLVALVAVVAEVDGAFDGLIDGRPDGAPEGEFVPSAHSIHPR